MFINAMRTGKHLGVKEGRPILPPMPWENLNRLSDEDLKAIFAYLKSLPAIKNKVPDPMPPSAIVAVK
jgi:cytochrome c553